MWNLERQWPPSAQGRPVISCKIPCISSVSPVSPVVSPVVVVNSSYKSIVSPVSPVSPVFPAHIHTRARAHAHIFIPILYVTVVTVVTQLFLKGKFVTRSKSDLVTLVTNSPTTTRSTS